MLAARHRMRSSSDFQRVRRNGKKVVMAGLVMHIYQGMYPGQETQVGLTVGKDCGNSVQRHRTSRRIRAVIRSVIPKLPPGTGLVVKALPEIHAVRLDSLLITESVLIKLEP